MLERVKLALRLTTDVFDSEIKDLIAACKADLGIAGVKAPEKSPLIIRATVLYVKANFGNNADSEKYTKSYESLKTHLAVSGGYHGCSNKTN